MALEEVAGTFGGPGLVQRSQTVAVSSYDIEDHRRDAQPDVERRTDGVRHLADPMAIGKAGRHFFDNGEASRNREPPWSSGYLSDMSTPLSVQPRSAWAIMHRA